MPTLAYGDRFATGLPAIETRTPRRSRRSLRPGVCPFAKCSARTGGFDGATGCAYALPAKMPSAATTAMQRATRLQPQVSRGAPCVRPIVHKVLLCIQGLIEPKGAESRSRIAPRPLHGGAR